MSDSYPSYPGERPSGQQPPAGPTQPGPTQPGPPQAGPPVASARPGSVTAASVITILLSALSVLGGIMFAVASGPIGDYVRDNPDTLEDFSASEQQDILDNLSSALVSAGIVTIVIGVVGVLLGLLVLRPRAWARILLTVGAGLSVLIGLLFSLGFVGIPWVIGSIAVIVLLFTGRSNDWFAGRQVRF